MENTLPEKYIQDRALEYLQYRYYKECSINGKIFCKDQATTKKGKVADGIIYFLKKWKTN